jgi:hypothetical protein
VEHVGHFLLSEQLKELMQSRIRNLFLFLNSSLLIAIKTLVIKVAAVDLWIKLFHTSSITH